MLVAVFWHVAHGRWQIIEDLEVIVEEIMARITD